MKKLIIALAAVLALGLVVPGCSFDGTVTTKTLDFTGFDNIEVGSAFQVDVVRSSEFSVNVTARQSVLDHLDITQEGNTLKIGLQAGWWGWFPFGNSRPKARITMPELYDMRVSGASDASATGFQSEHDTNIFVSGASSVDVDIQANGSTVQVSGASHIDGRLNVNGADIEVDGASRAELGGSGKTLDLQASGASRAEMEGMTVADASVKLSGASRATISPSGKISVAISGASSLQYTGNPSLESIDVSGASTIHRK